MPDSRTLKYGIGFCHVCLRGGLALTKDGKLRPHNVMPWVRRECPNRQAHLTPRAADWRPAPFDEAFSQPDLLTVIEAESAPSANR